MKSLKLFKLATFAFFAIVLTQSCSDDNDQLSVDKPTIEQGSTWSVRPDFATLDTRPADVIARHQVTEEDAEIVELSTVKAGGKYALVIGISDYIGTLSDLNYCDDDAEDWKARLETEGYSVTSLIDTYATKSAIETEVKKLAALSVAGNDIAFIYSGHGSRGNIISTDYYYISNLWFKSTFANATSTKMFFSFDACQVGNMKVLGTPGRVVAVASNATLLAYDGTYSMKNGVFTYYQMKAFDDLGYIYVEDDCDYAVNKMKEWGRKVNKSVAPSYKDNYSGKLDL